MPSLMAYIVAFKSSFSFCALGREVNDYKKACFLSCMSNSCFQVVPRYLKGAARGFPNQRTQMQQSDSYHFLCTTVAPVCKTPITPIQCGLLQLCWMSLYCWFALMYVSKSIGKNAAFLLCFVLCL